MVERSFRSEADQLGEWWDGTVQATSSDAELDAALAQTIRRFHALDDAPPADPVFLLRLERDLVLSPGSGGSFPSASPAMDGMTSVAAHRNMDSSLRWPAFPRFRPARRWAAGQFATAVLLLVTFVGVYLAFGPTRPDARDRGGGRPTAAVPGLVTETLLEVEIPAGALAAADDGASWEWFGSYALEAGTEMDFERTCSIPRVIIIHVESGGLAVRATGSLDVIRPGTTGTSTTERVPPETEVRLGAGDSLFYWNTAGDVLAGFRNPGPDRADLLGWEWRAQKCSGGSPLNMLVRWEACCATDQIDPSRPSALQLRRLTAEPEVVIPNDGPSGSGLLPIGADGLEHAIVTAGRAVQYYQGQGSDPTHTPERTYIYSQPLVRLDRSPPDMTRVVRNAGDEPLVIVTLTVVPASPVN